MQTSKRTFKIVEHQQATAQLDTIEQRQHGVKVTILNRLVVDAEQAIATVDVSLLATAGQINTNASN